MFYFRCLKAPGAVRYGTRGRAHARPVKMFPGRAFGGGSRSGMAPLWRGIVTLRTMFPSMKGDGSHHVFIHEGWYW